MIVKNIRHDMANVITAHSVVTALTARNQKRRHMTAQKMIFRAFQRRSISAP